MKALSSFLVLVFWVSSWFPTPLNSWAIIAAAACFLGGLLACLAPKQSAGGRIAKLLSTLSALVVIAGGLLAFATSALATPVDGAITLFFVLGISGYLYMIAGILAPTPLSESARHIAPLLLLASWSWGSSLGMYFHRGAVGDTSAACILVANSVNYDTELTSIWDMRLPDVAANRTGPTGTTILDYHAILVVPSEDESQVYNWSKRRMRFDRLDRQRNPYLPTTCP